MKIMNGAVVIIAIMLWVQMSFFQLGDKQPEAPIVTAAQIRAAQADEKFKGRFVIVDVRGKKETDVSVIPGAMTQAEFEAAAKLHQGKIVVVYCTVGYRSGIYAKKLRKKGWNAVNYKGSILDWCNNQLPVVTRTGESTKRVHTYNSSYSVADGYEAVY